MNQYALNHEDHRSAEELASLVRKLNVSGHNPATSGNYSLKSKTYPDYGLVSESGIDKSQFQREHFLPVHYKTREQHPGVLHQKRKASDETAIHLAILDSSTAGCVLHTHFLESLVFADLFPGEAMLYLEGLELLKGLKGINTHETKIALACFENTQDIIGLSERIPSVLKSQENIFGVMLRGHGLYVWGETVAEAKKHLEVLEYLIKYKVLSYRSRP